MAKARSKKPVSHEVQKYPRKAVPVIGGKTEEETARNYAAMAISPELAAYRVIAEAERKSGIGEELDTPALMAQLRSQAAAINRGDMVQAEAMLMNQATALQSLFARLAERGMGCDGATAFELNMRMALRAQSQCRATLETLSAIKHPPVIYAKQANIANGPQQINNGMVDASRKREYDSGQTQLLEANHGTRLDAGTASTSIEGDKAMEAVGEIHRAKDSRR